VVVVGGCCCCCHPSCSSTCPCRLTLSNRDILLAAVLLCYRCATSTWTYLLLLLLLGYELSPCLQHRHMLPLLRWRWHMLARCWYFIPAQQLQGGRPAPASRPCRGGGSAQGSWRGDEDSCWGGMHQQLLTPFLLIHAT
jgi:hypothetical protein